MHGLLNDLGIAILVAAVISYIVYRLKQPAVVGYLLAGIIIAGAEKSRETDDLPAADATEVIFPWKEISAPITEYIAEWCTLVEQPPKMAAATE